ncbi:hypothetical protein OTK49_02740 [Vibrio coralliirubri]|uniref:hypothetical protein n=1 Tax=Vibrio coralliirubri TaxID=1516159 RepID=UPI0022833F06|nr:hypothetical protein [Vibrio coralliirubri]MCY9861435.1 hypothetical protein [Vibrio coralliirubri]
MCTCNHCSFSSTIAKLDIKATHPEQYRLMEESFVICESLNTDTCMLAYNCRERLSGATQQTPSEIARGKEGRDFLTNASTSHDELMATLSQASEDESLPETIKQAIKYCALNVEFEIEHVRNILIILNSGQSPVTIMTDIVELDDARACAATRLNDALCKLISLSNEAADSESNAIPPTLVVDMDSSNSNAIANVKKLVLQPSLTLVTSVVTAARHIMFNPYVTSIDVKLDSGVFLGTYGADEDGDFELSSYSEQQLASLVHNNEFEITKLQEMVYNQKITVHKKHIVISCGLANDEIETCVSKEINLGEFILLQKELSYFCQ